MADDQHDMQDYEPDEHADMPEDSTPGRPVPPTGWNGGGDETPQEHGSGVIGHTVIKLEPPEVEEFGRARKFLTWSQVMALVSIFIGGVLLSGIAIGLAFAGYRTLANIAERRPSQPEVQFALKRSGVLAMATAALALAINVISIILLYPVVMQILQGGDLSSILGSATLPTPNSPTPTAPGAELFG